MEKAKYRVINDFTLVELSEKASEIELTNFTKNFLLWPTGVCLKKRHLEIPINDRLLEYAQKHECFIAWLIEGGYIEEVQLPEVFYQKGDRFKCKNRGYLIVLSDIVGSGRVVGIHFDDIYPGGHRASPVAVNNNSRITQQELDRILALGDWEKI